MKPLHKYIRHGAKLTRKKSWYSCCGMRHKDDPKDVAFLIFILETAQCGKWHFLIWYHDKVFIATEDVVHASCRDIIPEFNARHYVCDRRIAVRTDYLLQCADIFFQERGTKGLVSADPKHNLPWYKALKKTADGDRDNIEGCNNDAEGAAGDRHNVDGVSEEGTESKVQEKSKLSIMINRTSLDYALPFHIKHQLTDHIRVFNRVTFDNSEAGHGDKVQVKKYSVHGGRFVFDHSLVETIRGRRKKSQPKVTLRHVL